MYKQKKSKFVNVKSENKTRTKSWKPSERWSWVLRPAAVLRRGEGRGGLQAAAVISSSSVSVSWLSRAWWQSRAEQQDRVLLLGFGQESQTVWITHPHSVEMFDNSNYPFNCFNYDGDGYPSSSTDEEKKMCRPAYRYGPSIIVFYFM